MDFVKGIIYTIISAVVFGFTPILAKYTYIGGATAISLTFLRAFIGIPFLILGMRKSGDNLKITKREFFHLIILSFLGIGITTTFLYASYNYISVGLATTLHFIYPCVVCLICKLFFKEKQSLKKYLSLILSMVGIILLVDKFTGGSTFGVFLATFSGVTYGAFLVYLDKSGMKSMNAFKCTFYISIFNIIGLGIYGFISESLHLNLTTTAWILVVLISFLTAIFGNAFLQLGVKYCGASTASILCTFEPITSIVLGAIFLNEKVTILNILGCVLIVISVFILSYTKRRKR